MGFANAVIGGGGTLVRALIKSANYVAGSLGWQISTDGSAEFNQLTARGGIIVTPGSGLGQGIQFDDSPPHTFRAGLVENLLGIPGSPDSLWFTGPDDGDVTTPAAAGISLYGDPTVIGSEKGILGGDIPSDKFGWGDFSAPTGHQYYEEVSRATGLSIANGTLTTIPWDTLIRVDSVYGGQVNLTTGIWTCPEDGYYILCAGIVYGGYTGNSTRTRLDCQNITTGIVLGRDESSELAAAPGPSRCVTVMSFLTKGDQVQWRTLQNSGAAVGMSTLNAQHATYKRIL